MIQGNSDKVELVIAGGGGQEGWCSHVRSIAVDIGGGRTPASQ